ncbi:hypothetical protein KA977_01110 [Candidatus Dependentiae bacterium]|nr:hypothetical protein [Candidatus Dependentiae bacterium]
MKVTSQIFASEFVRPQILESIKDDESNSSENGNKIIESYAEDVLSITRENQKAVEFSLSSLIEAIQTLNEVKDGFQANPEAALTAQGNITPGIASALL